jgi:hypothetical protein
MDYFLFQHSITRAQKQTIQLFLIQSNNNDVAGSEKELHINTRDLNKDVERQHN